MFFNDYTILAYIDNPLIDYVNCDKYASKERYSKIGISPRGGGGGNNAIPVSNQAQYTRYYLCALDTKYFLHSFLLWLFFENSVILNLLNDLKIVILEPWILALKFH